MKITRKLTAIIALLLSLMLIFTSCSANLDGILGDLIDQIPGLGDIVDPTPDPTPDGDDEVQDKGFLISAENGVGTIYFDGTVSEGRFGGTYRENFAVLVTITDVGDGFILSFVNDGKTSYIVIDDASTGGSFTEDKFSATIFEWNSELSTYVVALDSNNRGFACAATSQYSDFSCYDASNASSYNFATFTAKNGATIANGEGGYRDNGEQGGNDGAETGLIENPEVGVAYKFGMVQQKLENAVYYLKGGMDGYYLATSTKVSEAIDVYLESTDGGYYLYTLDGSAKSYINFVVSSDGEHVNGAYESTASTVYRFDSESKTLIAEVNGADYWLATRNDKTYTTMGPCKVSYEGFYGQFYAQGGAGTGGSTGGNTSGGNQNVTMPSFDLSDIPDYNGGTTNTDYYCVINSNTPFFTEDEIAAAKEKCFETYASRDSLGRALCGYACVCKNTMPTTERGSISSVHPTGWDQNQSYNKPTVNGNGNVLYNRSHLIAFSLAGENANWDNLISGTEHMNQTTMQIFENMVLTNIKENGNKVLYRVTAIYNGDNLLATGVLMEAYSLHDNGDDIMFCVFVYNVQNGVHIDYTTGANRLATSTDSPAGSNAGTKSNGTTGGTTGGSTGGTTGGSTGGTTGGATSGDGEIADGEKKATVSISDYASSNSWVSGTGYDTVNVDANVKATVSGTAVGTYDLNTGKYYTSSKSVPQDTWRIYQTESATLTISAENGKTISQVKITYLIKNTGILTTGGSNVNSDTWIEVNGDSITFSVGQTGSSTKGQLQITEIEVIYK